MGLEEPGLNRVIRGGYDLLTLQTYFTAGVKEVRAWTFPVGPQRHKQRVKSIPTLKKALFVPKLLAYQDYIGFNGEQGAKDAGKWRLEGKDYIVKDGDVIHFRFNV